MSALTLDLGELAAPQSAVVGTNADLFAEIASLYLRPEDRVADVTFGRGGFWRRLPRCEVIGSDLRSGPGVRLVADFTRLPYRDRSVDVAVFDPPYRLAESTPQASPADFADRYGIAGRELATVEDLRTLYRAGMTEAARVLRVGGLALIKCQDFTSGDRLHLMHIEILRMAVELDLRTYDFLVLIGGTGPGSGRWIQHRRARRAHSYLLVLQLGRTYRRGGRRDLALSQMTSEEAVA